MINRDVLKDTARYSLEIFDLRRNLIRIWTTMPSIATSTDQFMTATLTTSTTFVELCYLASFGRYSGLFDMQSIILMTVY